MKIIQEISALVEKIDVFRNLRNMLIFGSAQVNKVSVIDSGGGGGGGLQERVCFSTF